MTNKQFQQKHLSMRVEPSTIKSISRFLLVTGTIYLVIGSIFFFFSWKFVWRAHHATGKIIQLIEQQNKGRQAGRQATGTSFYPVFTFSDTQGVEHTVRSQSGSRPTSYVVGESAPVLFNPDNPSEAKIDSFLEIWGFELIAGSMGVLSLIGCAILRRYMPITSTPSPRSPDQ